MTDDRPPPPPRRTLRHHLLALLVPPLAALTLLCGYVAHATAGQIAADRAAADATEATHAPAAVVRALQAERRATVAWLAPRPPAADALDSPGAAARAETARRAADATRDAEATLDPGSYPEAAERLAELAPLRTRAAEGRADWGLLYRAQTSAVSALLDTPGAEAGATVPPALDRAAELLARQDALLLAADADGALPAPVRDQFAEAAAGRTALEASLPAALTGPAREAFDTLGAGGAHRAAESAGERLAAPEQTVPAARELREEWSQAHRGLAEGYDRTRELARSTAASDAGAWPAGPALPLLAAALLAAALTLSLRAATRLRTELDAVREEALDVARRHLPSATRRARAGGTVDAAVEAPAEPGAADPLTGVRTALAAVHRSALRGIADAASAARVGAGADPLAPALARLAERGRHLADLQLAQLDEMEHRTTDPAALGELFRLDHLATRARRQTDLLASLAGRPAGAAAGDGHHRGPIDVEEVARAAQCEIEDYRRVEVRPSPRALLPGHAAGDLTRLLAELMENATRYSPTHAWVRVTGGLHPLGYAYRIEDRGPGLDAAALAEARGRLASAAVEGPGEDRRLGLFVAGRLAARHGVRIDLLPSDNAGLTVEVVVPTALLTVAEPCRNGVGDDAPLSA